MLKNGIYRNKSFLNAVTGALVPLFNGLLGIVITKYIVLRYGSDINGLNSSINQIINILMLLEGGLTLATYVLLFKPVTTSDFFEVSNILSSTRIKFEKIGLRFFAIGTIVSLIYSLIINGEIDKIVVFLTVFMSISAQALQLYFMTYYRALLLAQQKEYIVNFSTIATLLIGNVLSFITMYFNGDYLITRVFVSVAAITNGYIIMKYVQRHNKKIDFRISNSEIDIPGTKDVLVQKLTGMLYSAFPILFLSVIDSGGTKVASVFAIYNYVFVMVKSLLNGIIGAPRLKLGHLMVDGVEENLRKYFLLYEYFSFLLVYIFLNTTIFLIMPFINLYTKEFSDIAYVDPLIALLMFAIAVIELIHIPSGHLINMSGMFNVSKNFQVIASVCLTILLLSLGITFGVYGILISILVTSVMLAIFEIGYVHMKVIKGTVTKTLLLILIPGCISSLLIYLMFPLNLEIKSYLSFGFYGIIIILMATIFFTLIFLLLDRESFFVIINYYLKPKKEEL